MGGLLMNSNKPRWHIILWPICLFFTISLFIAGCNTGQEPKSVKDSNYSTVKDNLQNDLGLATYTEPGEFSIQYPSHWKLEGGGKNLGFEILSLSKSDPDVKESAHGGQDPNSAKIVLSIQERNSKPLDKIVDEYSTETKKIYKKESLSVNGLEAIRTYFNAADQNTPGMEIFIAYKNDKYVVIAGSYGIGQEKESMAKDIKQIQESFKVIN